MITMLLLSMALATPAETKEGQATLARNKEIDSIIKTAEKTTGPDALTVVGYLTATEVEALVREGAPALKEIHRALERPIDWKAKIILFDVLGEIASPKSLVILKKAIDSKNYPVEVRAASARALGRISGPASERVIKDHVENPAVPIQIKVALMQALSIRGFEDVQWLELVASGATLNKSSSSPVSIEEGAGVMWNAMRALGTTPDPQATDVLIRLQDRHPANGILTEALRRRKDRRSIPILIKVVTWPGESTSLSHEDAAIALGEMKAREATDVLMKIVQESPKVLLVARAAEALAEIGDKKALPVLKAASDNITSDPRFSKDGVVFEKNRAKLLTQAYLRLDQSVANLDSD